MVFYTVVCGTSACSPHTLAPCSALSLALCWSVNGGRSFTFLISSSTMANDLLSMVSRGELGIGDRARDLFKGRTRSSCATAWRWRRRAGGPGLSLTERDKRLGLRPASGACAVGAAGAAGTHTCALGVSMSDPEYAQTALPGLGMRTAAALERNR